MRKNHSIMMIAGLIAAVIIGQGLAFLVAPASWREFNARLPVIIAMVGFWGPVCAVISAGFVYLTLRLLGFKDLEAIRHESVDQNNPTPAILFVGTLIASILFLILIIRP